MKIFIYKTTLVHSDRLLHLLNGYPGMAAGRDLLGHPKNVIAVIGDGGMTAGQAYEAMNNPGILDSNLIIILNDNKQVSLPTATINVPAPLVGDLSKTISKIQD